MKRVQYDEYGDSSVVYVASDIVKPSQDSLGTYEVIIAVQSASINAADWKKSRGMLKMIASSTFPKFMGT